MGTVLIHAGMPKTGSTSIQAWLRKHATRLSEAHRTSLLHVAETPNGPSRFEAVAAGDNVNTISFLMLYHVRRQRCASARELSELADEFVAALDRAASERGTVLLTAEGFASLFIAADEPFLRSLDRLAQRHTVRIAYYVRPQHTALEARWRQWGFRSEMSPSGWVLDQADSLRYADTVDHVRRLAPNVSFEARPFRSDLLEGGDVVADFVRGFLRIDRSPATDNFLENPGLSLDLAILLRGAPASLLDDPGSRIDTGARQLALGRLGRSWTVDESPEACASRDVLHRYAYREFEPRNRDLAADLGWRTQSFVPPPEDVTESAPDLADLDTLWKPHASATTLAYFYAALSALVTKSRPQGRS